MYFIKYELLPMFSPIVTNRQKFHNGGDRMLRVQKRIKQQPKIFKLYMNYHRSGDNNE